MATTLVLALAAIALLTAGFAARDAFHRYAGLSLFAVTIAKLVAWDVWHVERIYQIALFTGVRALLVGGGFLYARFGRRLVTLLRAGSRGAAGPLALLAAMSLARPAEAQTGAALPTEKHALVRLIEGWTPPAITASTSISTSTARAAQKSCSPTSASPAPTAPRCPTCSASQAPRTRPGGSRPRCSIRGSTPPALRKRRGRSTRPARATAASSSASSAAASSARRGWRPAPIRGRSARSRAAPTCTASPRARRRSSTCRSAIPSRAPPWSGSALSPRGPGARRGRGRPDHGRRRLVRAAGRRRVARAAAARDRRDPAGQRGEDDPRHARRRRRRRAAGGGPPRRRHAGVQPPRRRRLDHVPRGLAGRGERHDPSHPAARRVRPSLASTRIPLNPTRKRFLRLTIHDGDSAPLSLSGAQGEVRAREIVFRAAQPGPHRLYVGDALGKRPKLRPGRPPRPHRARASPAARLGAAAANPALGAAPVARDLPFTERHRTAIGGALAVGLLALSLWAARLLKRGNRNKENKGRRPTTPRRHGSAQQTASPGRDVLACCRGSPGARRSWRRINHRGGCTMSGGRFVYLGLCASIGAALWSSGACSATAHLQQAPGEGGGGATSATTAEAGAGGDHRYNGLLGRFRRRRRTDGRRGLTRRGRRRVHPRGRRLQRRRPERQPGRRRGRDHGP